MRPDIATQKCLNDPKQPASTACKAVFRPIITMCLDQSYTSLGQSQPQILTPLRVIKACGLIQLWTCPPVLITVGLLPGDLPHLWWR